jgi:V8-like Glu-specific endopeptidase
MEINADPIGSFTLKEGWQTGLSHEDPAGNFSPRGYYRGAFAGAALALVLMCSGYVQAQSTRGGSVQSYGSPANTNPIPPSGPSLSKVPLATQEQFSNAEKEAPNSVPTGTPGVSSSGGNAPEPSEVEPQAFGTSTAPYTTARVAVTVLGDSSTVANTPVTSYPYRATGKLYFKEGTSDFVCTASLIKKGVLLTAAHCVFNYGKGSSGWYNSFV